MIEKTLPPEALPQTKADQQQAVKTVDLQLDPLITKATTGAREREEFAVDKEKNYPKAKKALSALEEQTKLLAKVIDESIPLASSPLSAGYGSLLKGLPNSDAKKLENNLNTIKANIGFDALQAMREASPTGGALGQVSDFENKLLQATKGTLDQAQSEQLKENLISMKTLFQNVLEERKKAFEQDYGELAAQPPVKKEERRTVNFMDLK
jgi:hypothetical protein